MAVGKSKKKVSNYDPLKEKGISELAAVLEGAGFEVRREKLKQGIGYKVMSGTCHFNESDIIFVDRKLPQDDQLSFLATKIIMQGIEVEAEKLPSVSPKVVTQINDGVRELKESAPAV